MDEAAHNGERIGIDDEKEEGADSLKTGGSASKKKLTKWNLPKISHGVRQYSEPGESNSKHKYNDTRTFKYFPPILLWRSD